MPDDTTVPGPVPKDEAEDESCRFPGYDCQVPYGVVRITGGRYRGRLGFYDDDDFRYDGQCCPTSSTEYGVIFLGDWEESYVTIEHRHLKEATETEEAAWRAKRAGLFSASDEYPNGKPKEAAIKRAVSTRRRFEILKRDGFKCKYCGASPDGMELHVDHIIPLAAGGSNEDLNLVTSCKDCNLGKSSIPLDS